MGGVNLYILFNFAAVNGIGAVNRVDATDRFMQAY